MNYKILSTVLAVSFCFVVTNVDTVTGQESGLEILRHYEGDWVCSFTIQPQPPTVLLRKRNNRIG